MQYDNWKCSWFNDHVQVSLKKFSQSFNYKLVHEPCCKICGTPLIQGECGEFYRDRKLKLADGAFQLGHYFPVKKIDEKDEDDRLTNHLLNLKDDSSYAEPIGKALALLIISQRILLASIGVSNNLFLV